MEFAELYVFDAANASPQKQRCHFLSLVHHLGKIGVIKNCEVTFYHSLHDQWCSKLSNPAEDCNCNPIIAFPDGQHFEYSKQKKAWGV